MKRNKTYIAIMTLVFFILLQMSAFAADNQKAATDFSGNSYDKKVWELGFPPESSSGLSIENDALLFKNTMTGDGCYFGPLNKYDNFEVIFDITKCNNDVSNNNIFLGLSFGLAEFKDYYAASTSTILVMKQDGKVSVTKAAYAIDYAKKADGIAKGYQMKDIVGTKDVLTYRIIGKPGVVYVFYKKQGEKDWNKNVAVLESPKIKTAGYLKFTTSSYEKIDISIDNISVGPAPEKVVLPSQSEASSSPKASETPSQTPAATPSATPSETPTPTPAETPTATPTAATTEAPSAATSETPAPTPDAATPASSPDESPEASEQAVTTDNQSEAAVNKTTDEDGNGNGLMTIVIIVAAVIIVGTTVILASKGVFKKK